MKNISICVVMAGIEKIPFFEDRPQLLVEQNTKEYSLENSSVNLDFETFIKTTGFYQR